MAARGSIKVALGWIRWLLRFHPSLGFYYSMGRKKRERDRDKEWKKKNFSLQPYSVQFSRSVLSDSSRPHESKHARRPCPLPSPGVHSDSCPSSPWCHPAIPSSVVPFSYCPHISYSNKNVIYTLNSKTLTARSVLNCISLELRRYVFCFL